MKSCSILYFPQANIWVWAFRHIHEYFSAQNISTINIYSWKILRKLKWQIPGDPLAARYNWCQGPVPVRGPVVEKHWSTQFRFSAASSLSTQFGLVLRLAYLHSSASSLPTHFGLLLLLSLNAVHSSSFAVFKSGWLRKYVFSFTFTDRKRCYR